MSAFFKHFLYGVAAAAVAAAGMYFGDASHFAGLSGPLAAIAVVVGGVVAGALAKLAAYFQGEASS